MTTPDRTDARALRDRALRLHERAATETGLNDFGDDAYPEALNALLQAVTANALLAPYHDVIDTMLVSVLRSRLYSEAGWRAHSWVLGRELRTPLMILGPPRTGTTILHNMLSRDPQFQTLEHWLIDQPMIRPPRSEWEQHPGYRRAAGRQRVEDAAQRQKHHIEPDEPDECIRLMLQTFVSNMPGSMWPIAEYDAWFAAHDETPSYRRYTDNLRLIGAGDERPFLLKNPNHLRRIDTILDVWPDARIVQTHRDPIEQIPSICSLLAGRRRKLGRSFVPVAIGERELACWSQAVDAAQRVREQRHVPIFDAYYVELVEHPMQVIEACYAHFGLTLSDNARRAMVAFLAENPRNKHGVHRYDASEYGLDDERIRRAFAEYIERHHLHSTPSRA